MKKKRKRIAVTKQPVPQFQFRLADSKLWADAPFDVITFHELRAFLRGKFESPYGIRLRRIYAFVEVRSL